jgi:hypothetical protein
MVILLQGCGPKVPDMVKLNMGLIGGPENMNKEGDYGI